MTTKMVQGALGLAINKQGQFLITQRNEPKLPLIHKKWQLAGGGIEFGESPEQALAREVQEELGVSASILYPHPMAKTWVWKYPKKQSHVLLLCYLIDIGQQKITLDEENLDYRWIKPKELFDLEFLPLTDDFIFEAVDLVKQHNLTKLLR